MAAVRDFFARIPSLFFLARKSAWNRRFTLLLVTLSISLSTVLLVGLERIRAQVRAGFTQAVSGTDLVVGARGSPVQLILYAVFHMGGATNNMSWKSAEEIASRPEVAWTIPLSMGDSHRGYPVVATNGDFFKYFRHRRDASLEFSSGRAFADVFEVVLGSEVASRLGYREGDPVVLTHGGDVRGIEHADKPFAVVGILQPTGSPVDRSLYISLESMEAIHVDWRGGAPVRGFVVPKDRVRAFDLNPKVITAMLVGLKNRRAVFTLQREIQASQSEALSAVLPGVAMDQLWSLVGGWERVLILVSLLVTFTGLAGLSSTILAGLGERRRELAILRSTGASPWDIVVVMAAEGVLLTFCGMAAGLLVLVVLILAAAPWLLNNYGLLISLSAPTGNEWLILSGILVLGVLTSLVPALRAYFLSLSDGLSPSL
ncbi:MAG: ABC transporter permease [Deltaproteobacteria bacterium]|jgi:putative ABC transport system permease protein|nr:ABC transporter permease [Deltaproteobacteria bacterium]